MNCFISFNTLIVLLICYGCHREINFSIVIIIIIIKAASLLLSSLLVPTDNKTLTLSS